MPKDATYRVDPRAADEVKRFIFMELYRNRINYEERAFDDHLHVYGSPSGVQRVIDFVTGFLRGLEKEQEDRHHEGDSHRES